MSFEEVLLGDLCDEITVGHVGTMANEYVEQGVPFLRSLNIQPFGISMDDIRYITPDFHSRLKKSALAPGDVVIVRTGKPGTCAVIPKWLETSNCSDLVIARCGPKLLPRYACYWINSLASHHISSSLVGAVQQHFNVGAAKKMPVLLPSLTQQEATLSVLGSLDDKIELNRKTNETLEAMAQAIFKDWFVDFGPVRRKMEGANEPSAILGGLLPPGAPNAAEIANLFPDRLADNGLPEGWEERALEADFDIVMGQSPPGDSYNEDGDGMVFFQGRRDFGWRFPTPRVFCTAPTRMARRDWSLISVRAPVGDLNRAWEDCCIGRGVGAFMHKKELASLTYYLGHSLQSALASFDKDGTVFGSINKKQFANLYAVGMNTETAKAFDLFVSPFDLLIRSKSAQIDALAETRDYLLPRLMNGSVSVEAVS